MEKNHFDTTVLDAIIVGRVEPHIYAFTTETIPNYLKVGDTYRAVNVRLDEWRKHFPHLIRVFDHTARTEDTRIFRDYSVHAFLEFERHCSRLTKNKFPNQYFSNEFFENATRKDVADAIDDIYNDAVTNAGKYQFYDENRLPETYTYKREDNYKPRPNQQDAINKFKKAIKKGRKNLLMYAVMRFGKSFTSMCCADEINAKFVVIVSAKADVQEEWKKTVESHKRFVKYKFATSNDLKENKNFISDCKKAKERIVLFLTLQDLQGKDIKGKHSELFKTKIDLLLVDESHFGARASEYGRVLRDFNLSAKQQENERQQEISLDELTENLKVLEAKITMHLSGTPYRILMSNEFMADDIVAFCQFTDIIDEKERWDKENLAKDNVKEWDNPYYGFPQMVRFAFNPCQSVVKKIEALKKNGISYAMSELLRPKSISKDNTNNTHKEFIHATEVLDLFEVIDGSKADENVLGFLDYEKIKEGQMCRHIVIVLPFRASCDALENLIICNKQKFKNLSCYTLVNIAGVDSDKTFKTSQDVKRRIKECEKDGQKTITLTVNRMLTGSTVEQWDTMIYLKDTESPQDYDQAVFRLQNQYIKVYGEGDDTIKFNMKPQTLLVDFDINRIFRMQEQKSQIYNVNTNRNGNSELQTRIQKELYISPIIVLNKNKLSKVEPTNVMDAVREYSRTKSVVDEATGIPTDFALLENDTIRGIIEKLNPIDAQKGIELKAYKDDDGEDMEIPGTAAKREVTSNAASGQKDDEINKLKKKLATFYAQILFYALLTESRVKSLSNIISDIDKSENNKRICKNVGLSKEVLIVIQKISSHNALSQLDYKIDNINTQISDRKLKPIERVEVAMKKFGRLSSSEIVTPAHVADDVVALLPDDKITSRSKILDIAAKQGEFTCAMYRRFGEKIKNNVFAIPTSPITYEFTRKVYNLLGMPIKNIFSDFTSYDLLSTQKETIIKKLKNMKFDAIVGNPPYQVMDGGGNASATNIYNDFVDIARKILPQYISMIMPARWYAGGKGLDEFRASMLSDNHIETMVDYPNPKDCFPNTNISGGVCYFLWNKDYKGDCSYTNVVNGHRENSNRRLNEHEVFVRYNKAISVIRKVTVEPFESISKIVYARNPFDLDSSVRGNENKTGNDEVKVYSSKGEGYLKKSSIQSNTELIGKYKLLMGKVLSGHIGETDNSGQVKVIATIKAILPNEVTTDSYLIIGAFDNHTEAKNIESYFKTKLLRFLLLQSLVSMNISRGNFRFVPLQDFTSQSDIDWTKSIAEIDRQLYAKYNLTDEEIAFIEQMIKPME